MIFMIIVVFLFKTKQNICLAIVIAKCNKIDRIVCDAELLVSGLFWFTFGHWPGLGRCRRPLWYNGPPL